MKVDLTPCGRRYRNYSLYASCRWTSILWHTLRWSLERNMLNRWKLGSLEEFFHSTCKDVIEGYCIPKLSLILERNQVYWTGCWGWVLLDQALHVYLFVIFVSHVSWCMCIVVHSAVVKNKQGIRQGPFLSLSLSCAMYMFLKYNAWWLWFLVVIIHDIRNVFCFGTVWVLTVLTFELWLGGGNFGGQ